MLVDFSRRKKKPRRSKLLGGGDALEPLLPKMVWPLDTMLREIRDEHFPHYPHLPSIYIIPKGPLACICYMPDEPPVIYMHAILNDPRVPRNVFHMILTHELLHTQVPSRIVDGKRKDHPPEFFEIERQISPEYQVAWDWVKTPPFIWHLRHDEKREGILVDDEWSKPVRIPPDIRHRIRPYVLDAF